MENILRRARKGEVKKEEKKDEELNVNNNINSNSNNNMNANQNIEQSNPIGNSNSNNQEALNANQSNENKESINKEKNEGDASNTNKQPEENKEANNSNSNQPQQQPQPQVNKENKIQNEFKNIFQGRDFFSNNTHRKRLLHLTFVCILVDILILQILCLFLNVCYGEQIEMQLWVSNSIAPLCVILLFFYIILYFSSDLISKPIIKFTTICITILLVFFIGIGIFTLGYAASLKENDMQSSWDILSKQSKLYYYDNDINVLWNIYNSRMMLTGGLYLLLGILSVVVVCFSYQYYEKLTNDWRPPLRARLSDERAQRYIDLYSRFNKDYKRLYDMENFKVDKEKEQLLKENKLDNIIDAVPSQDNNQQEDLINKENQQEVAKNEFPVEDTKEDKQKQKKELDLRRKKSINLRRRATINTNTEAVDENTKLK